MPTDHAQFLLLLNWMSPAFPIGTFAFSHGMEQAIADGRLQDAQSVEVWISDLLSFGSGWNDAALFARCWHEDAEKLNELALALAGSAERFLETTMLGRNFNIAAAIWTGNEKRGEVMAYPIVAGLACRDFGIPQEQALIAFLQGFSASLVSVAVRLVPLGQTHGLKILRNLSKTISSVASQAPQAALGSACLAAEIAAMQHEKLEPRIFRT